MFKSLVVLTIIGSCFAATVPNVSKRILGGNSATLGQFPYQVSLRDESNNHFCSAALIHPQHVLTTYGCATKRPIWDVVGVVGSVDLNEYFPTKHYFMGIYVHPTSDLTLLHATAPFAETAFVRGIPTRFNFEDNRDFAVVSGWGLTSNPGYQATTLKYLNVEVLSNAECRQRFSGTNISESSICTITSQDNGLCYGDEGSPVTVHGTLVGIVSKVSCGNNSFDVVTSLTNPDWFTMYLAN